MGRKPQKNDSLPGSLDMWILRTLSLRDLHGYGIVQFIQKSSNDELLVLEGSLYPALQRLELKRLDRGCLGHDIDQSAGEDLQDHGGGPQTAALAILSLAIGIGANTAIYSLMESILLRSLPVANPESLVVLNWHGPSPEHGGHVVHSVSGIF